MTKTDIDTQAALDEQETEATLPWESIDPDEVPESYVSPFASTATIAVEAKKAGNPPTAASTPILLDRFAALETEVAWSVSEAEREEQLADRAFFSDQKISIEMLKPAAKVEDVNAPVSQAAPTIPDVFSEHGVSPAEVSATLAGECADEEVPTEIAGNEVLVRGADPTQITKTEADNAVEFAEDVSDDDVGSALRTENVGMETAAQDADSAQIATEQFECEPAESLTAVAETEADEYTPETEETAIAPRLSCEDAIEAAPRINDIIEAMAAEEKAGNDVANVPEEPVAATPEIEDSTPYTESQNSVFEVVSRTIPADAFNEPSVTVTTSDSLANAAAELSSLSRSIVDEEVEQAGDQTILVTVSPDEGMIGLAEAQTQFAVERQFVTQTEVDLEPELETAVATAGGGWTIPLMCMGLGLIACCMAIPQGEANRRLRYEQVALNTDLQQVQKQVAVNEEFLKNVADDPTLAERLAGRQMKTMRKGQQIVDLKQTQDDGDMSPFSLVAVAKPADLPAYKPKTGTIANLCNNGRSRLYLLGTALGMVAVGLVMGFGAKKPE